MVESNFEVKIVKGIAKNIEKFKDKLTKKEKEYLTSFSCNASNFSGLPKIQKFKLTQNAIKKTTNRVCAYYRTIGFKTKTKTKWTYLSDKNIE